MQRVVITGMGIVCALGNNKEEALKNAMAGRSGIRRCDELLWEEYGKDLKCRVGGTVKGFDAKKYVPEKFLGMYDRATTYSLGATDEAIRDSGLDFTDAMRERTGVVMGNCAPGNELYHRSYHKVFVENGAAKLSSSLIPQLSAHAPAALVALERKFRGPTFTISSACGTGGSIFVAAVDAIRAGRADVVIAGSSDAPIGLLSFGSMLQAGAMFATDDPNRASKPFSKDRGGLIIGEGAGSFVLERYEDAMARGARIYAEILGDAMTNDAFHIYSPDPTGESWARTMGLALKSAGIAASDVQAINAHAASTGIGDLVETKAVKRLLGDRASLVPITATKSMHGHTWGAAGAIETALAIGAMCTDTLLPTINLTEPDPECDLDYVPNQSRHASYEFLLKNSFGFIGTNTSLVFKRMS